MVDRSSLWMEEAVTFASLGRDACWACQFRDFRFHLAIDGEESFF